MYPTRNNVDIKEEKPSLSADERLELQKGIADALMKQDVLVDPSTIRVHTITWNNHIIHSSPILLSPQFASVV